MDEWTDGKLKFYLERSGLLTPRPQQVILPGMKSRNKGLFAQDVPGEQAVRPLSSVASHVCTGKKGDLSTTTCVLFTFIV